MLKNIIFTLFATSTLLIAGCNGGDDVEVEEFRVNGSSSELEDGRVTIDSAINNGEFELVWEVDDDNASGYNAYFWLSVNSNLDEDNDVRFYYVWCGECSGSWKDGQWRVLMKRPRDAGNGDLVFNEGT
ncbi:MAG: hypothetical protein N0E55_10270, partial [Candidatus Thiodiazotropha taylori]|nr:hypothetical protein [Candidatus Thiodiazotropha taylori]MCW4253072.1 hypothetical protein [Candidatus Thiodiazotropha taylori]